MKGRSTPEPEMRDEYDFSNGVRGKYASRFTEGANIIILETEVTGVSATRRRRTKVFEN
jgi:hypothetical protein